MLSTIIGIVLHHLEIQAANHYNELLSLISECCNLENVSNPLEDVWWIVSIIQYNGIDFSTTKCFWETTWWLMGVGGKTCRPSR